jgi:hypothetical protein
LRDSGRLLQELGLVVEKNGELFRDARLSELLRLQEDAACQLLLALVLDVAEPLWLRTAIAGDGTIATELIPDEARDALVSTIPDAEEREALLLALANKFDPLARAETGDLGERYVVGECQAELERLGRPDLAAQVRQVSVISDQLGYDVVAPHVNRGVLRLEVKTTRRASAHDVSFFLSRNEARFGGRDSHWRLVVCRVRQDGATEVVGSCGGETLEPFLPTDTRQGKWTAAALVVPIADLHPGLPSLGD